MGGEEPYIFGRHNCAFAEIRKMFLGVFAEIRKMFLGVFAEIRKMLLVMLLF